ncbi:Putative protein FAM90A18/FAM90A19 [Cricetulus griseus]|uniref:Zinc knuckle domain-containing protein n=1 Tax=Cricetulus griseus TaxID=10029 RepID=G3HWM8_CRIGR|nr:Putative protein FAM90A18/FAM90A19 [Cricetulus griseus]
MAQKVPPEEEENTRVKCKDCGAFGHTSKSSRCPNKGAYGFLVPQPQVRRKEKENRYPGRPQTQETLCQNERDKRLSHGSGQRQEEGQPMPIHDVLKPEFKQECRKAVSEDPRNQNLLGMSSHHRPRAVPKLNEFGQVFNVESKDQAPRTDQPRLPSRATLVSARPCTESQEPLSACVAGQSLKMIFTRTRGDCWTCRFMEGAH